MQTKFQLFKQRFFSNFIMSKEVKKKILEHNLKLLIKVSFGLFSLCLIMFFYYFLTYDSPTGEIRDFVYYYLAMTIEEFITFVLSIVFLKIKKINRLFCNIPLIFNFLGQEIICYAVFVAGTNPFNSLIIFVCLATIIPLIFAIEPLYYVIVMVTMGLLMSSKMNDMYGMTVVNNSFVYILVMSSLAMSRWFYIIKTNTYEHETKKREKQIQQELEMAALVQKSFYQHDLTEINDWNIACYNDPMISLSGDLFDFFVRKNNLTGLCIFDVSGHGLASGLVTMMVKNTMEEEFYNNENKKLQITMKRINERICEEKGKIDNYLTGIILRFKNRNIEMVNAGHPIPIIYHSSTGLCEYLNCNIKDIQGAIGFRDFKFDYSSVNINIEPGDRIVLYTDGVIEAKNELQEEYGKARFLASVKEHCNLDINTQLKAVFDDIKQFIGTAPRTDDISLIILSKS